MIYPDIKIEECIGGRISCLLFRDGFSCGRDFTVDGKPIYFLVPNKGRFRPNSMREAIGFVKSKFSYKEFRPDTMVYYRSNTKFYAIPKEQLKYV